MTPSATGRTSAPVAPKLGPRHAQPAIEVNYWLAAFASIKVAYPHADHIYWSVSS